ncbi:MAG TPA: F0F1 ATP synthase subunit A [Candidatus Acidoferrum sp.]|nr:F0F1 ATP synthase subunit A [Candidatus Acidoferrum sp.]
MEYTISWLTKFVNLHLGHAAMALLAAMHITPSHPETPIPEQVVMGVVAALIGTLLALFLRFRLSVDKPGATQQLAEWLITNSQGFGIRDILRENAGHDADEYIFLVGSITIFILISNLFGVIPTVVNPPTSDKSAPFAAAILVFCYFNWRGFRKHGALGYWKTFTGGVHWTLVPLIFPVEIISTFARLLSLTVRLWANIFASDLLYELFVFLFAQVALWGWQHSHPLGVAMGILPATLPLIFLGLHTFVSFVQAYVFTILPSVYLGMATAESH